MEDISLETLGTDINWMKRLLFASVFIDANKLQTVFDRYHEEVSSKQWLLLVTTSAYDEPPTLTQIGEAMGCSRQNVKKIAVILERKGYVELTKDLKDARSLRIVLTEKFAALSYEMEKKTEGVFGVLFKDFTEEQIVEFYKSVCKLTKGIDALDMYFSNMK